jgi:hypothetical protein
VFGWIVNRERSVVMLFAVHKVASERQNVRESDFKLDLFATQSRRGRQGRDLVKRPFELLYPFKKRGSRQRSLSGFAPQGRRLLDQSGFGAVTGQQLRLTLGNFRELVFKSFGDAGVQRASRLAQQRAVGCVLHQGVFEQVGRMRQHALPGQQTGRNQTVQRRAQLSFGLAKWSWLKAWAMKIARHRGMKKAIVALARRLAVIMHRIWVDGTEFRWTREVVAA